MPLPPASTLHSTPAAKECQILGVCHRPVYSPSQMEVPRGGIYKDVLHAVADPDIQIVGRGSCHPGPEIRGCLKKNFFGPPGLSLV